MGILKTITLLCVFSFITLAVNSSSFEFNITHQMKIDEKDLKEIEKDTQKNNSTNNSSANSTNSTNSNGNHLLTHRYFERAND